MPQGVLLYRWYAKTYGWTPDQVRELPADVFDWLPAIEIADAEAAAMRQKAEEARNRGRSR